MNPPTPAAESEHVSVLEKQLCLSLSKHWSPIGVLTIRKAIVALCSESGGVKPAFALDIEMGVDENGAPILVSAIPIEWDAWVQLPVRPGDLSVMTHRCAIRAPTVIVSANFDRNILKRPRLSTRAIWERDNGTCQYTGKQLPRSKLNIDHVVPRDRGGKDEWHNLVLADSALNAWKGNRLNSEVGLTLIRSPKAPPALPVAATIGPARHPTWVPFLLK